MDIQSLPQLYINFDDTSCSFTTPATICPIPLQNCATTCPGATSVQKNIEYAYWTVFYDTNRDVGDSSMQNDYGRTINYNQKMFLPDESGRLFTKKNPNLLPVTLQRGLYNLQTDNDSIAKTTCSKFYVVITKENGVITNGTVKYLKPPNYLGKHGYGGVEFDISAKVPQGHTLSFGTAIGNINIDMSVSKEYFLTVDHEYPDFFHYHTLFESGSIFDGYEVNIPVATVLSIDGVLLMNEDSAYTTNNACFNLSGTIAGFEFGVNYTSSFCCVEWDVLPSPTPNPVTTQKPSDCALRGCPVGWTKSKTNPCHCYIIPANAMSSWSAGNSQCGDLQPSATLTSIDSVFENVEITAYASNFTALCANTFFIGLHKQSNTWQWANNDQSKYINWKVGYPNPNGGDCAALVGNTWVNTNCDISNCFICEYIITQ
uniref:C-type lectin domain-containing protein n=1 Tax=Acrobeloides nanus TaxID=290746 RepID=A0A914CFF8_9BILA